MQSDRHIQRDVVACLSAAPGVDPADIGVFVQNGIVVLTGTVESFAEREAAEAAALTVPGVFDIANEIDVMTGHQHGATDEAIAGSVRDALELHSRVPHEQVKCCVSHAVVTLHGAVGSWQDVVDIEETVGDVAGVDDVIDELVVAPD